MRVWAVGKDSGQLLHTLVEHTNGVRCVIFSPDGQLLISSSYDHKVIVWDVKSGRALYSLPTQGTTILSLAFHPQGGLLALGLNDHTVRLCDLATKQFVAKLIGHTNSVECIRFSPDGQWMASASADETVILWDVAAALAGRDACRQTLRAEGPYAGMNITGVTGISAAQKAALKTLGAVEEG